MATTMVVEVKLFARLRELCDNRASLRIEVPTGASAATCFDGLCERYPAARGQREALAVAVNEEYAAWDRSLQPGDVLTLIPPVSGG